jgi:hypothetical protein
MMRVIDFISHSPKLEKTGAFQYTQPLAQIPGAHNALSAVGGSTIFYGGHA